MFEVTILESGSAGNALLIRNSACAVLVDAGVSARRLRAHLESCGLAPEDLAGILITHEHGDHTRGLKVLAAKSRVPVFANALTVDSLRRGGVDAPWRIFCSGGTFAVGSLDILPFSVPHDAADPVGFVVRHDGAAFAVLTDLGYATRQVVESVRGVDALLIETNHDETLLQGDKKRPWSVKQRILSRHGHLSNDAAAEVVAQIATDALRHVVLGHLSRDCNSSDLALRTVEKRLEAVGRRGVTIRCPAQDGEGPALRIAIR